MAQTDPMDDYRQAVDRLGDLTSAVAQQAQQSDVMDAVTQLRLAVVRAYGGQRPRQAKGRGARRLILDCLVERLGEWVYGDELAAVSGIGEWARRVRELRVEEGYEIEEDAGRYRLRDRDPNTVRRNRWRIVTELKAEPGSAADRVRLLFEALVGRALGVDELDRVSGSRDGARFARELRNREFLPVEAGGDAPDLRAGEYRLGPTRERDRLHPSQRLFSEDLRGQIFKRDRYTCWTCHQDRRAAGTSLDAPFFLAIRHLDYAADQLFEAPVERLTDPSRLATLCNRCIRSGAP